MIFLSKLYIQNLGLIITGKCNLECKHCLCGGEITLAMPTIEKILTYIVDNKVPLGSFSTTINGTIYSEEFLRLLDYINEYISPDGDCKNVIFGISKDIFHEDEILRLGMREKFLENLSKYVSSPYFYGWREIDKKLFREGRASFLDDSLTVPLRPYQVVYSYLKKSDVLEVGRLMKNRLYLILNKILL